jgi:predicted lysophospholipase L1 biosynthesis ABC-type transport system permease subunit
MPTDPASAILQAVAEAQRQVAIALWLSGGMVCSSAMIALLAAGWRKPALGAGLLYAVTLCFVPVGRARVLGSCAAAAAAVGLMRRSPRARS